MKIPTEIVKSVSRCELTSRQVAREFKVLTKGPATFRIAGKAKKDLKLLESRGLLPRHKIELFQTQLFLSNVIQIPELRFYVANVVQKTTTGRLTIFPRIFYKDLSLVWRSASHFAYEDDGHLWIGKGDVRYEVEDGDVMAESIESTTDLPLEIQSALEGILGMSTASKGKNEILSWVLRQGPSDRVEPYDDFIKPRESAAADPRNLINRGKSIAKFRDANDPLSLKIVAGFEPDFENGILERSSSHSKLYGGRLQRFRILSTNRTVQYYFIAGPKHVWIIPPQATTTQLSSFAVRTIDVIADDNLFIPGYEYHHEFETESGVQQYTQIPHGFAGETCPFDEAKADASPWLDKIPVIQDFRRLVIKS